MLQEQHFLPQGAMPGAPASASAHAGYARQRLSLRTNALDDGHKEGSQASDTDQTQSRPTSTHAAGSTEPRGATPCAHGAGAAVPTPQEQEQDQEQDQAPSEPSREREREEAHQAEPQQAESQPSQSRRTQSQTETETDNDRPLGARASISAMSITTTGTGTATTGTGTTTTGTTTGTGTGTGSPVGGGLGLGRESRDNLPLTPDARPAVSVMAVSSGSDGSPPPSNRPQLAPTPSRQMHFERTTLEFLNNVDDDCDLQWLRGFGRYITHLSEKSFITMIRSIMRLKLKKPVQEPVGDTQPMPADEEEALQDFQTRQRYVWLETAIRQLCQLYHKSNPWETSAMLALEDVQRRIYRFTQLVRETYLQYLRTYHQSVLQETVLCDFQFLTEIQYKLPLLLDQAVVTLQIMKRTEEHSIKLQLPNNNIDMSLYDFTEILLSFHIGTVHSVWSRVAKNEDGCIGDKSNLGILVHLLFSFAIKRCNPAATYPKTNNPIYHEFLVSIVDTLFNHYVKRSIRMRELIDDNEYIMNNNQSQSPLVVGFEDVVDKLVPWLLNCDQLLQHKQHANNVHKTNFLTANANTVHLNANANANTNTNTNPNVKQMQSTQ